MMRDGEENVSIKFQVEGAEAIKPAKDDVDGLASSVSRVAEATREGIREGMTWVQFLKERMGSAMKEAMSAGASHSEAHVQAIRKISEEWKNYKSTFDNTTKTFGDAVANEKKELSELQQKYESQNLTLKEAARLKTLLNREHSSSTNIFQQETPAAQAYATQIAKLNDLQSANRIATKAGHESYFALGEDIRRKVNPAMLSLGNIIQDAPYGIRGVGNNIEFLTQQMVQMSSQGITARQMFSGMIASLTGPTGILMAISVITSLATVFGDKLFPNVEKTDAKVEEMRDKISDLQFSLSGISSGNYFDYLTSKASEVSKIKPDSGSVMEWLINVGKGAWQLTGIPMALHGYDMLLEKIRQQFSNVRLQGSFSSSDLDKAELADLEANRKVDGVLTASLKKKEDGFRIQNESSQLTIQQLQQLANEAKELSGTAKTEEYRNKLLLDRIGYLDQIKSLQDKQSKKPGEESNGYSSDSVPLLGTGRKFLGGANPLDNVEPVGSVSRFNRIFLDNAMQSDVSDAKAGEMRQKYIADLRRMEREEKRAHDEAIRGWKEENQVADVAINSVKAGFQNMIASQLMVTRQAVSGWDSAWLAMENTAINALSRIAEAFLENAAISWLMGFLNPFGMAYSAADLGLPSGPMSPVPRMSSSSQTVSLMNERRSTNQNGDVIRAINNINLKFSMSSTKTAVALQGANRINKQNVYGSSR